MIAAIGPEAQSDKRGFDRVMDHAVARLAEVEVEGETQ